MIADTSLLIALDGDDPDAIRAIEQNEASGRPIRIPTAVVMELYISVGLGSDPNANADSLEALVATHPVVDLDENIARKAGTLLGIHRASDTKPRLGVFDAVIAATGLAYAEPVITADTDDFGRVDGLQITTW